VIVHRLSASILAVTVALSGCGVNEPSDPPAATDPSAHAPAYAAALSSYFPPPETNGGWRKTSSRIQALALGIDIATAESLRGYLMALPWEGYSTGVTGYKASDKASLIIKKGWLVGEYYNQASARDAVYYLASNGKTFAMMLLGRMQLDYPALEIGLGSRLYDSRWLPQGFPLSDSLKTAITLDQVFRHTSGIVPEAQASIAGGAVRTEAGWNFVPFTLGLDAEWPVSGPLYFSPGSPSSYTRGSTYSSVAFNHFSLVFRNVTQLEPGAYLRQGILDPIGVGRMAYKRTAGMDDYQWATAGNGLSSARDFARLAYLLLHEGEWGGRQLFTQAWIRSFTGVPAYPNLRSNQDCYWGAAYPTDLYSTIGSGFNRAIIVPSLDLVFTFNGRTPSAIQAEVTRNLLQKLFASVTDRYVTCDGRVINNPPPQRVAGFTLINADTDQPIGALTNTMTISLATLPTRRLNVRADTWPSTVGSVRFGLDAAASYRIETGAPYALAGDIQGNYKPWTPAAGTHTLKATPYTGAAATGAAGLPLTVTFTIK
jgi:CubicO group peptidase (beta-lactamase class C family)